MRGYVSNEGNKAYFVCQRQIPPGGRVELDDIYKSVGKKSGLEDNQEFIEWIKTNIFKRGSWGYYEEVGKPFGVKSKKTGTEKENSSVTKTSSKKQTDARGAGRALSRDVDEVRGTDVTPSAIIEAPYEQARALIEKSRDKVVLKKALNLTQHFSGKEQHMRHLVKRLEQVY